MENVKERVVPEVVEYEVCGGAREERLERELGIRIVRSDFWEDLDRK